MPRNVPKLPRVQKSMGTAEVGKQSTSNSDVNVIFTRDQAEFVLKNASTNWEAGLRMIGQKGIDQQMAERIIAQMDQFKPIIKLLEKALK